MIIEKTFNNISEMLSWYNVGINHEKLRDKYPPSKYNAILSFDRKTLEITKKENNMKKLEKADVRKTAKELIKENDTTTTLEIKEELRKNKFWATQSEIALHMDAIEQEENLNVTQNGQYRTFAIKKTASSASSASGMGGMNVPGSSSVTPTIRVASSSSKPTRKKRGFKWTDAVTTTDPKAGDWFVTSTNGSITTNYKGDVPRYTVRRHYAITHGVNYILTRAKRVS